MEHIHIECIDFSSIHLKKKKIFFCNVLQQQRVYVNHIVISDDNDIPKLYIFFLFFSMNRKKKSTFSYF